MKHWVNDGKMKARKKKPVMCREISFDLRIAPSTSYSFIHSTINQYVFSRRKIKTVEVHIKNNSRLFELESKIKYLRLRQP